MTEEKKLPEEAVDEIKSEPLGEVIGNEQEKQSLTYVEILYGTVTAPNDTFSKLAQNPPVILSIVTILGIYLFTWLLNLSDMRNAQIEHQMFQEFGANAHLMLGNFIIVMGLLGIVFLLLTWFILSGSLNLWAVLLGGKGNAKGLFVCYGLSMLPSVFSEVLQTAANLLRLPGAINWLIVFLTFIWIIYLQITSIRATQGLTAGISFFVALTPIIIIGALMLLMTFLMFAAFFPLYQNFFNI